MKSNDIIVWEHYTKLTAQYSIMQIREIIGSKIWGVLFNLTAGGWQRDKCDYINDWEHMRMADEKEMNLFNQLRQDLRFL